MRASVFENWILFFWIIIIGYLFNQIERYLSFLYFR